MKRVFYLVTSIIIGILIVIDVSMFATGSLEMYPTAEQIEKGRIVYGLIFVLLMIAEAFVVTRIFKKK